MKVIFNSDFNTMYTHLRVGQVFIVEDHAYIKTGSGHTSLKNGVTGKFAEYSEVTQVQAVVTLYPYNTDKV